MIVFVNISYGGRAIKSLNESLHPRYSTIEIAAYISTVFSKANWTALSQSAFQMNQCNGTSYTTYQPPSSVKPFKIAPEMANEACHRTIFVHDAKGNDLFDGTFERPVKIIQTALSLARTLRAVYNNDSTLCITIRGGTYYLGTNVTTSNSQIGAIALTSNDNNLVIENYQDERIVLSGDTFLHLQRDCFWQNSSLWYNYESSNNTFHQSRSVQ